MAYATIAQLRTLDGLSDSSVYPDATLTEAIDYATALIDGYCGTSFEAKSFDVTVDGSGCARLRLPLLYPRTLTEVRIDGTVVTTTGWMLRPEGIVVRPDRTFPRGDLNVRVVGTAGVTTAASPEVAWAARTLAAQYARDLHSRIPDRALALASDFGTVNLAQAGGPYRPTSLPDVNAVLNRHRHRGPLCF